MKGDDRARFCTHCRKNVYNLSAMPRDEAERLVCESAGSLCVRYERTSAGEVVTLDYDRSESRRGWRFWTGLGIGGAVIAAVTNAMFLGRTGGIGPPVLVQGEAVCVLPPPTTAPACTVTVGGSTNVPAGSAFVAIGPPPNAVGAETTGDGVGLPPRPDSRD